MKSFYLDRATYNFVQRELYRYEAYKKELILCREEILEGSPSPPDGQPKGNQTGNPTEQKALKLVSGVRIINLERTIAAISNTLSMIDDKGREVFREIYVNGRHDNEKICMDLCISLTGFKDRKHQIIYLTAENLGLLK